MKKNIITKEKCFKDLCEMFSIPSERTWDDVRRAEGLLSYAECGSILIYKGEYEREEVIKMLQSYFKDKVFEKGYGCSISKYTMVWTEIKIINVKSINL